MFDEIKVHKDIIPPEHHKLIEDLLDPEGYLDCRTKSLENLMDWYRIDKYGLFRYGNGFDYESVRTTEQIEHRGEILAYTELDKTFVGWLNISILMDGLEIVNIKAFTEGES